MVYTFIVCLWTFLAGAIVGFIAGRIRDSKRKAEKFKDPMPDEEQTL